MVRDVTISNAICFSPDRDFAYYTDTCVGKLLRQRLDDDGWPQGEPFVFIDLSDEEFGIDGAIVDPKGNIWNAQWGAFRVACYSPDGKFINSLSVPTLQTTCPAFGGDNLTTLFVTTAADGLKDVQAGKTYMIETSTVGQPEYQVIL